MLCFVVIHIALLIDVKLAVVVVIDVVVAVIAAVVVVVNDLCVVSTNRYMMQSIEVRYLPLNL